MLTHEWVNACPNEKRNRAKMSLWRIRNYRIIRWVYDAIACNRNHYQECYPSERQCHKLQILRFGDIEEDPRRHKCWEENQTNTVDIKSSCIWMISPARLLKNRRWVYSYRAICRVPITNYITKSCTDSGRVNGEIAIKINGDANVKHDRTGLRKKHRWHLAKFHFLT